MDYKSCMLLETVFNGYLTTKDLYVIFKYLFNTEPVERIFSKIDTNVFIDFVYGDGKKASDYLGLNASKVEDYDSNKLAIVHDLTCLTFINDDIEDHIKHSTKIKRFLKQYKKNNLKTINKAADMKTQQQRLKDKGIDDKAYDFIKDAICLTSRK